MNKVKKELNKIALTYSQENFINIIKTRVKNKYFFLSFFFSLIYIYIELFQIQ